MIGIIIIQTGSVSFFMTVRCFMKVPWSIYLCFPSTLFLITMTSVILLSEYSDVYNNSQELLKTLNYKAGTFQMNKALRKIVSRSLSPIGIRGGPFGTLNTKSYVMIMYNMVSYGITLIISIPIYSEQSINTNTS